MDNVEPFSLDGYQGWFIYKANPATDRHAHYVLRHESGLVCKIQGLNVSKTEINFALTLRTPCCGVGFMRDREEWLCLTCKTVLPLRARTLPAATALADADARQEWAEMYFGALEASLIASEVGALAQHLIADDV